VPVPTAAVFTDWRPLLTGSAFWALALYLPLSRPLERMEEALAEGSLDPRTRVLVLTVSSLLLALAVGGLIELALSAALGPGWASSLGLMAVLAGAVWTLGARQS
jgi:hypothetical protein